MYEVREENKGTLGLATARQFKPDLILLDINMPDMEGSQVAFQIRTDGNLKSVPIVFLTTMISKEEAAAKYDMMGDERFIAKPATRDEILEHIEICLGRP